MDNAQPLLDAALLFGSTRSLPQLLKMVLHRMVNLLGAERALFAIFDYQGEIEYAETHNLSWGGRGTELPISNKTIEEVRHSQEICRIADANIDLKLLKHESIRIHALRFVMAMPVHARDRVAGVLYVDSRAPMPDEAERQTELLRGLATFVGLALENLLLYHEQRLRTALLDQLAHDLRTPLQVVSSNASWLGEGGASEEDLRETARDIEVSALKMNRMIEVNRRLSMVDAGVAWQKPAPVDVADTLRTQARVQRIVAREYGLTFAIACPADLPRVLTHTDRLDIVLDNLVFNALKHARADTEITLAARTRADAGPREATARPMGDTAVLFQNVAAVTPDTARGFVEVSVHNHGPPIAADLIPRVFDAWVRGDDSGRSRQGSGLGLSIVHQCVRSLGGAVWVESDEASGTRFSFTVPVAPRIVSLRPPSVFPTGGSAPPRGGA